MFATEENERGRIVSGGRNHRGRFCLQNTRGWLLVGRGPERARVDPALLRVGRVAEVDEAPAIRKEGRKPVKLPWTRQITLRHRRRRSPGGRYNLNAATLGRREDDAAG